MTWEFLRDLSFVFENYGDSLLTGMFGGLKGLVTDLFKFVVILIGIFGIWQGIFQLVSNSCLKSKQLVSAFIRS